MSFKKSHEILFYWTQLILHMPCVHAWIVLSNRSHLVKTDMVSISLYNLDKIRHEPITLFSLFVTLKFASTIFKFAFG